MLIVLKNAQGGTKNYTYYPIACINRVRINRNNLYTFDHTLSWGIKNRTPYPIVRINRVRINEVSIVPYMANTTV